MHMFHRLSIVLSLVFCLVGGLSEAWGYPDKPITLIIPVGAGGSHDLTARALASVAVDYLGQPIIVTLKPGGGGAIGSDFVSKSAPDGYTLMMGYPGQTAFSRPSKEDRRVLPVWRQSAESTIARRHCGPDRYTVQNL